MEIKPQVSRTKSHPFSSDLSPFPCRQNFKLGDLCIKTLKLPNYTDGSSWMSVPALPGPGPCQRVPCACPHCPPWGHGRSWWPGDG